MSPEEIARLIRAGLPGADVRVQSDDGTHFQARIVAEQFAGKRSVARHQLVYRTLGERMGRSWNVAGFSRGSMLICARDSTWNTPTLSAACSIA